MRIRSIKPEFWRSEDISCLERDDRLLFIGLWSYVDDNGVGVDRLATITADLFAADLEQDARETFARVSRGLQNLADASLICRYLVGGRTYLAISAWAKHQRVDKPNKPRYPSPDQHFAEVPRDSRETVARVSRLEQGNRGTEEQGNRGTEEQGKASTPTIFELEMSAPEDLTTAFNAFWKVYPRREGKQAAQKAFEKAVTAKGSSVDVVLAGAQRYATDPNLPSEKQYIPYPQKWLNEGRWDDDPLPPRLGRGEQKLQESIDLVGKYREMEQGHAEIGDGQVAGLGTGSGWENPY